MEIKIIAITLIVMTSIFLVNSIISHYTTLKSKSDLKKLLNEDNDFTVIPPKTIASYSKPHTYDVFDKVEDYIDKKIDNELSKQDCKKIIAIIKHYLERED